MLNAQLYTTVEPAWAAMLDACRRAQKTIDFEQFIVRDDPIGSQFIEVLKERARAGVRVRILCDVIGSGLFYLSGHPQALMDAGAQVLFFSPISPLWLQNFMVWYFRDHRKLLIVDSAEAYTGGVGMNAQMAKWRDTHVRVTGPIVRAMERTFGAMWTTVVRHRFVPLNRESLTAGDTMFLPSAPRRGQRLFYWNLIDTIRSAKRSVYLTTAYFIPDRRLLRVLRVAAHRGVDVRLLVPGASDLRIVDHASSSYFDILFRAGIRVYRYRKGLLHAKTGVIDGSWGTVGSANLDNLSLLFNYEANLVSSDRQFIEALTAQFFEDLQSSEEITAEAWRKRPMIDRVKELMTWPIHGFL